MTDEEQRRIFGVNLSYQISISGKMQKEIALDLDVNQTTMRYCEYEQSHF